MQRGFTLIELLVAISIVAILSVIGLVAYSSVQKTGRDSVRKSTLRTIASSIEANKGSDGKYKFITTQLQAEFPQTNNPNAYAGTDPSGYPYCVVDNDGGTMSSISGWTSSACPSGWETLAAAITGTGKLAAGSSKWTVCTLTENNPTAYCINSLTK